MINFQPIYIDAFSRQNIHNAISSDEKEKKYVNEVINFNTTITSPTRRKIIVKNNNNKDDYKMLCHFNCRSR